MEPCIKWGPRSPPEEGEIMGGAYPDPLYSIGNIRHAVNILNVIW